MTEFPPARYRVVERGRKLEVVDTWAGRGAAPAGAAKAPSEPGTTRASGPQGSRSSLEGGRASEPRRTGAPPFFTSPFDLLPPRPSDPKPIAEGDGSPLAWIAVALTGGAKDADGRPLLTTAPWYDRRAPRTLALSEARVNELGGAVLAVLVVTLLATGLLGWAALAIPAVLAAVVSQHGKALTTRWLDRVAAAGGGPNRP